MKIISWNVASLPALQGFIEHEKGSMSRFLEDAGVDIMCFQETKLNLAQVTKKLVPFLLPEGGWHTYWAVGNKQGYCGIATFTKTEPRAVYTDRELLAEYNEEGYGLSTEGRLVVTDHGEFLLFNVYVPNSGKGKSRLEFKRRFIDAMYEKMEYFRLVEKRRVILVGDLNLVANKAQDMHEVFEAGGTVDAPTEHWFRRALGEGGYLDTFRELHPDRHDAYSYWDQYITTDYGLNRGCRIDYILVSTTPLPPPTLQAADIVKTLLKSPKASDHAPTMVELELPSAAAEEGQAKTPVPPPFPCCVKHKVDGKVLLAKLLPDPKQPTLKGFFTKKKDVAAAGGGAGNGEVKKRANEDVEKGEAPEAKKQQR